MNNCKQEKAKVKEKIFAINKMRMYKGHNILYRENFVTIMC